MWKRILESVQGLHREERGSAMVEYAIITAVIALVALSAAQSLGTSVVGVFEDIVAGLTAI